MRDKSKESSVSNQSDYIVFVSNDLACVYCNREFKYLSEKTRHELSHSARFECKVCHKIFSFQSALRRHEKQHERKGSVKCEECKHTFRDDILLKRHIKYAHEGVYSCTKCKSTYSSEAALKIHLKIHKPKSERQYKCSHTGCDKSFNFPHHLKHHELTHTNSKQHFCAVCGKGFIQSHHLKIHLKAHEPENWLLCLKPGCGKKFPTEYARKRHLATHKPKSKRSAGPGFQTHKNRNKSCKLVGARKDMSLCSSCGAIIPRKKLTVHALKCTENMEYIFSYGSSENLTNELSILENESNHSKEDTILCHSGNDDEPFIIDNDNVPESVYEEPGSIRQDVGDKDNLYKSIIVEHGSINQETCDKENLYDSVLVETEPINQDTGKKNNFYKSIALEPASIDQDVDMEFIDFPNDCKSVLGGCLVSGNSKIGENCICAKMSSKTADSLKGAEEKIYDDYTKSDSKQYLKGFGYKNTECEGCVCADTLNTKKEVQRPIVVSTTCTKFKNTMPKMQYRLDGVVKIEETFDINITILCANRSNKSQDPQVNKNKVTKKTEIGVPFNSCKDVLGNCIVSGNDTIGEGCLCAKMAIETQQATSQEIEEISICPQGS